jgi:methyl-accepting chemotaxis protein
MSIITLFSLFLPALSILYMLILWLIFKGTVTFKLSAAMALSLFTVSYVSFLIGLKGLEVLYWAAPLVGITFVVTYWGIDRFLSKPLRRTYQVLFEMGEGDGDLSRRLDIFSKDEIGKISTNFNSMVGKLSGTIQNLKKVGVKGSSLGNELASSSEELSATVEEIASTINSMSQKIATQSDEMRKANVDVGEIRKSIDRLNALIDGQSDSIGESSAAIEEMVASIKSIEGVTDHKKKLSDQVVSLAESGRTGMEATVAEIEEIATSAEAIFDFVSMIDSIASQTNLLAMNASIEAAHAGEFGKGFSVVADEIRKLAETTAENSNNISSTLRVIVDMIKASSENTKKTGINIVEIISGITDVSAGMNETLEGLKELSLGSSRITESLGNVVRSTSEVRSNFKTMTERIEGVEGSMASVANLSEENRIGMAEISSGANEVAKSSEFLAQLSASNATNISALEEEITRFKIG